MGLCLSAAEAAQPRAALSDLHEIPYDGTASGDVPPGINGLPVTLLRALPTLLLSRTDHDVQQMGRNCGSSVLFVLKLYVCMYVYVRMYLESRVMERKGETDLPFIGSLPRWL